MSPKQYWHLISVFLQKIQSVTMPALFLFFVFSFFPHRNYSLLVMNYYVGNIRPHFLSLQLHTYGKWLGVPHRATLWAIIIRACDAGKSDENRTNRWADFYELCWLSSCKLLGSYINMCFPPTIDRLRWLTGDDFICVSVFICSCNHRFEVGGSL